MIYKMFMNNVSSSLIENKDFFFHYSTVYELVLFNNQMPSILMRFYSRIRQLKDKKVVLNEKHSVCGNQKGSESVLEYFI